MQDGEISHDSQMTPLGNRDFNNKGVTRCTEETL